MWPVAMPGRYRCRKTDSTKNHAGSLLGTHRLAITR
jgi:hypothetical protein